MYFFFHLITGIIIGLLLGDILRDPRWILPCAVGAVLPDLVDKPLGFILFQATINNGRIWFHGVFVFVLVLVIGLVAWRQWKSSLALGIAAGTLSHQILDLMWRQPDVWLYPFLGPFRERFPQGYLMALLLNELANPWEWILVIGIGVGLIGCYQRRQINRLLYKHQLLAFHILTCATILLGIFAAGVFLSPLLRIRISVFGWNRPEEYFIGSVVIAAGGYLVWRWRRLVCTEY
jgi:hypothetical protein